MTWRQLKSVPIKPNKLENQMCQKVAYADYLYYCIDQNTLCLEIVITNPATPHNNAVEPTVSQDSTQEVQCIQINEE
jgi:hypothetical protein